VYSRLGHIAADEAVVVRNPGGSSVCRVRSGPEGSQVPRLEGNATFVYRAVVNVERLRCGDHGEFPVEMLTGEISAYELFYENNLRRIHDSGILF
jgi:diaminopimelate epimerase